MFTLEEYKLIAGLVDAAPIQGTLSSLPAFLSKLIKVRVKLQGLIDAMEKEDAEKAIQSDNPK